MNRAKSLFVTACLLLASMLAAPDVAFAQVPADQEPAIVAEPVAPLTPPVSEEQEAPATRAGDQSLGGMIVSGGVLNVLFFAVLGVFSLWAATVVLERIFNLKREKILPESFSRQLNQIVEVPQSTPLKFKHLCESSTSPASRIFHAGVLRAGRSVPEVEKAMEDAAAREMAVLRARSRPLNVVGNIAPLVGLLGTVVGMIIAFQISSQEGLGKAERLAEGIYLALMTTAAGLTIAIPCLLFASWFHARAERYMCDIDECLMESIPSFAKMEGADLNNIHHAATRTESSPRERFLSEGVTGSAQG